MLLFNVMLLQSVYLACTNTGITKCDYLSHMKLICSGTTQALGITCASSFRAEVEASNLQSGSHLYSGI